MSELADWPDRIFAVLKQGGIGQVGYVPDAGHARLIALCRADLAKHKVPAAIRFVSALAVAASGKLARQPA